MSLLDPTDWSQFRREAHAALDQALDRLQHAGDGPVWRPMPEAVRDAFAQPLPRDPMPLEDLLAEVEATIAPYVTGNTHPLFMGWVHGAGTPVGMVAEMLAAGLNANCGGRDHVGLEVERQITRWAAALFAFPADASGVFVTGTSMANFLAVLVARTDAVGAEVRASGVGELAKTLTAYTSVEAHGCVAQAMELAGLGSANLRRIGSDPTGALRIDELEAQIAEDQRAGRAPFLLVGTAGSVNTGAFDDLAALADVAARHRLWFHVDGAFGALFALSERLRGRIAGIERAQSIAFDFHKWAHVPYDAGFLLVRHAEVHRRTFASPAAYLSRAPRGLAAGDVWPCDLGPDLSRGFRALKAWMTIRVHGADRLGAAIERCCAVARHLEARLRALPRFEIVAPAQSNIVCYSLTGDATGAANRRLVMDLHEQGIAVPSITVLGGGRAVIRSAIVNHRTTEAHMDAYVDALARLSA